MKEKYTEIGRMARKAFILLLIFSFNQTILAQNSILVNFGSQTCTTPFNPSFSLIKNPLAANPVVLATCNMAAQLPDYYNTYVAYNPKDNKLYISDIRTGTNSRIWLLDVGLPGQITCPANIPVNPTFSYNYIPNNFEFDNNGDLWSFSNYNAQTGRANLDKFDLATGTVVSSKVLQFPVGKFPTTILSGDLTILPNGRLFATLGNDPSILYEIVNYQGQQGEATANYLVTLPKNCYGIAYLNGVLEIAGNDFLNQCYYYEYSIAGQQLGQERSFQNGQSPIDNTSITPSIGVTKELVEATLLNSTTAQITYEIFIRNMGNVQLNDVNIVDDLAVVFGAPNVSNVSVQLLPDGAGTSISLNPGYNGISDIKLFAPGQSLSNQTLSNTDYFCKVRITCTVSNLLGNKVYLNSAIGEATINNVVDKIVVADSSNNGTSVAVDPDYDGNPGGVGENVPTPFSLTLLPVKFLSFGARLKDGITAELQWRIGTPVQHAKHFDIQFSTDGRRWKSLDIIPVESALQSEYAYIHHNVPPGDLYYRVRQTDNDGVSVLSNIVLINRKEFDPIVRLHPNPVAGQLWITGLKSNVYARVVDLSGRVVVQQLVTVGHSVLNVGALPDGVYLLVLQNDQLSITRKIVVHQNP